MEWNSKNLQSKLLAIVKDSNTYCQQTKYGKITTVLIKNKIHNHQINEK